MIQLLHALERNQDLVGVNALSILQLAVSLFLPVNIIRLTLGFLFVLFFPGYIISCAFFPAKKDLSSTERVALSIGLSLAIVPLVALFLNYTFLGIGLDVILLSLLCLVVAGSTVASVRRERLLPEARFAPAFKKHLVPSALKRERTKLLAISLTLCVIVLATVAYLATAPKADAGFTEFYILGPNQEIANYPENLTLGQSGTVTLGVVNHENQEETYCITTSLDNVTLAKIGDIKLGAQETWHQSFTFTPSVTGRNLKLEFFLYKEPENKPYRNVYLWITVHPAS